MAVQDRDGKWNSGAAGGGFNSRQEATQAERTHKNAQDMMHDNAETIGAAFHPLMMIMMVLGAITYLVYLIIVNIKYFIILLIAIAVIITIRIFTKKRKTYIRVPALLLCIAMFIGAIYYCLTDSKFQILPVLISEGTVTTEMPVLTKPYLIDRTNPKTVATLQPGDKVNLIGATRNKSYYVIDFDGKKRYLRIGQDRLAEDESLNRIMMIKLGVVQQVYSPKKLSPLEKGWYSTGNENDNWFSIDDSGMGIEYFTGSRDNLKRDYNVGYFEFIKNEPPVVIDGIPYAYSIKVDFDTDSETFHKNDKKNKKLLKRLHKELSDEEIDSLLNVKRTVPLEIDGLYVLTGNHSFYRNGKTWYEDYYYWNYIKEK